MCAVNCAVEESTIADRAGATADFNVPGGAPSSCPLGHDGLVARALEPEDVVVVSMGGNDVVLKPKLKTILCMYEVHCRLRSARVGVVWVTDCQGTAGKAMDTLWRPRALSWLGRRGVSMEGVGIVNRPGSVNTELEKCVDGAPLLPHTGSGWRGLRGRAPFGRAALGVWATSPACLEPKSSPSWASSRREPSPGSSLSTW